MVAESMLGEIREGVGRIEGEMRGIRGELKRIADVQITTEDRVRKLEQGRAWLAGVTAAVSAIVASFVTLIGLLWGHK